jgi:hypothetical protein
MVYGELGRYPIDIDIKVRTISYWARLLSGKQAKFSNVFYSWIFTDNLYNLTILRTSYIALSALSERCFLVTSKLHVFVKINPK